MSTEKETKSPAEEVVIALTKDQQEHIERVTGKLVSELKVEVVEDRNNPSLGYAIGG